MADIRNALFRLRRAEGNLDPEVPIFALSRGVIRVLRQHAPVDTGNLKSGIGIVSKRRGQTATIGVALDATGRRRVKVRGGGRPYDYVGVTRFGHKAARIYPKQLRPEASVVSTRRRRKKGRRGVLAVFFSGSGPFFFKSVKGYKPKSDWVADAAPEIEVELKRVSESYRQKLRKL